MNEPTLISVGEIAGTIGFSTKHVSRHWREWGLKRVECGSPRTLRFRRDTTMRALKMRGMVS